MVRPRLVTDVMHERRPATNYDVLMPKIDTCWQIDAGPYLRSPTKRADQKVYESIAERLLVQRL